MNPKSYITVGLQFGDEGKGTIVDSLVRQYDAKYVIRYSGGHQCAHNVVLPDGTHHTFSQFGSGTFAGAKTILTEDVIVEPIALLNEAEILKQKGISNPFENLFIHEDCLVTTPYHAALNRIRELSRDSNNHGSCGVGIGETRDFALKFPDDALRIKDLQNTNRLIPKLACISLFCEQEAYKIIAQNLPSNKFKEEIRLLKTDISKVIDVFKRAFSSYYKILVNTNTIQNIVNNNITVFEGAQGTLLDEHYGFHPYTTWSTVTCHNALKYVKDIPHEIIGILRTYTTRHGAGPLPTEDKNLTYPELHNGTGKFQGAFRLGHFDLSLFDYAMEANDDLITSLAVTHFDVAEKNGEILFCDHSHVYKIKKDDFALREEQTARLSKQKIELGAISPKDFINLLESIGVPVKIISRGPIYLDKEYL